MYACLTISRRRKITIAAAMTFLRWDSQKPLESFVRIFENSELPEDSDDRELHCFKTIVRRIKPRPECVLLDLSLNNLIVERFYNLFKGMMPVIGMSQVRLKNSDNQVGIFRKGAKKPLFVSVAGLDDEDSKLRIQQMHGDVILPEMMRLSSYLAKSYHIL